MAGQAPAASPIDFERSTLYMNELKIFEHPKFGNIRTMELQIAAIPVREVSV